MNKIFRLVWNQINQCWVAVAECAKGRGKASGTIGHVATAANESHIGLPKLKALTASLITMGVVLAAVSTVPAFAQVAANQLPTGGNVVAGSATIGQNAAVMNINQTTNRAAIDWNTFNVGAAAQVNFNQPSTSSVTLNRVQSSNPSQIFGRITAPGQVFLTNPSGVYFAPGSSVDVGGLVATTHRISTADFMAGNTTFDRNGSTGSVINEGELKAALGGYIALLAPEVRNNGVIIAQAGTVALASGEAITLNFGENNTLAGITATQSQIDALVENKHAVLAPGGLIILSAQAMSHLQGGVINNSGNLEAAGLVNDGGRIFLEASDTITHTGSIKVDAAAGQVGAGGTALLITDLTNPNSHADINGSISARGGDLGGDGGFIETSAGRVQIGDATRVDTSPLGNTGKWLIDPVDFIIAAMGGDITGSALGTLLDSNSVTIQTATGTNTATDLYGTTGTNGDIFVNDAVTWNAATRLTLNAERNIDIRSAITAVHADGAVTLKYGQGATDGVIGGTTSSYGFGLSASGFAGQINLQAKAVSGAASNFITKLGSTGADTYYTVITSLGSAGSTTATDLQGIKGSLTRKYVLGANIDATATSSWNTNAGFDPIGLHATSGSYIDAFGGHLDGLGHTISNLTISRPNTNSVGLFGFVNTGGIVRNVGLTGGSVSGNAAVGMLVGHTEAGVGISNSYAAGSVNGTRIIGGLIGESNGSISNSHSTSVVTGTGNSIGGLVGTMYTSGSISNSYATGTVSGASNIGGLAGVNSGNITNNSYATGAVTGGGSKIGGMVGGNFGGISASHATGVVNGAGNSVGGLVGANYGTGISNSYATGAVTSTGGNSSDEVGGLVGTNKAIIADSYATGAVAGASNIGGLAGSSDQPITNSYSSGAVTGSGSYVYGLVGSNRSTVTNSYYDIDSATINGSSQAGPYGIYGGQFSAWKADVNVPLDIANYASSLVSTNGYYEISSLQGMKDLLAFAENTTARFRLTTNLSLPSGYYIPSFKALEFDGGGNVLSGLTISSTADNIGFVGKLASGSTLSNLGLANVAVTGNNYVGGLVGRNDSGSISNSHVAGEVTGSNSVGGLVGRNVSGTISNSYASVTVTGGTNVGGLVGYNYGSETDSATITNSYATGVVTGLSGDYVGGLVGYNFGSAAGAASITDSHATGNVFANSGGNVGGLVGSNSGYSGIAPSIANSYSTGNVFGYGDNVGGLVGSTYGAYGNATISNSYATGNVTSYGGAIGGLVGYNEDVTISNSYATGTVTGDTSFSNGDNVGGLVGYNYGTEDGKALIENSYATGVVIGHNFVGGLVGWNTGNGNGAASITTSYATGAVSGLGAVGGLVGYNYGIANGAVLIENAYATGAVIAGFGYAGGLVGINGGLFSAIRSSFATGAVSSGGIAVGGLVGGLVGGFSIFSSNNNGQAFIENSYATGTVSGSREVGGLVGRHYNASGGNISNSFATGAVTSTDLSYGGGLVGKHQLGAITASFYDTDVNAGMTGIGFTDPANTNVVAVTGKTSAELKELATFNDAGWSIRATGPATAAGEVWRIYEGNTTPLLVAFLTPLDNTDAGRTRLHQAFGTPAPTPTPP